MKRHILSIMILQWLLGCEESSLGPSMDDSEPSAEVEASSTGPTATTTTTNPDDSTTTTTTTTEEDGTVVTTVTTTNADGSTTTTTTTAATSETTSTTAAGTASCTRTTGHNVYYVSETVTLVYTCDATITALTATNQPDFLTSSFTGTTVTFTGPTTEASTNSWSFLVNGVITTGDSTAITTNIIATSNITIALQATPDVPNNRATDLAVTYTATLGGGWDGTESPSLGISASTTDAHGLTLATTCTGTYWLCQKTRSYASNVADGDLYINYQWSAFDQGTYYFTVTPSLTIGSTTLAFSDVSSTFTIPQLANTYAMSYSDTITNTNVRGVNRGYQIAIGGSSTAKNPILGVLYTKVGSAFDTDFKRLAIDRSVLDTDGSTSVSLTTGQLVSDSKNSTDFKVLGLSSGNWLAVGFVAGTGLDEIQYSLVQDSTTAPSISSGFLLTNYEGGNNSAISMDLTDVYTDTDSTSRVGLGFVYYNSSNSTYYLTFSKLNPAGTAYGTVDDTTDYDTRSPAYTLSSSNRMDHLQAEYFASGGTGYFVGVYREQTNIKAVRIKTTSSGGYGATTATVASGAMDNEASTSTTNYQSLDMDIGVLSGTYYIGIVYQKTDNTCQFIRIDQTLTTVTGPLAISTRDCYHPNISYNSTSGKFVITYSEKNLSNNYDIGFTEVTIASTGDTKTDMTIVANTHVDGSSFSSFPIKLSSALYESGAWMGLIYKIWGQNEIRVHGYHVPGR